jgi:hypothetical protein
MKRFYIILSLLLLSCISSCDLMDYQVAINGCVSSVDYRVSAGGFASSDIKETILTFTDGRVMAFSGIYNRFRVGQCYNISYFWHHREITNIRKIER